MIRPLSIIASLVAALPLCAADAQQLAERIDKHLSQRWHEEKVQPAPRADDAEFFRRVSLDLTGRIPRVRDVYDFLADDTPDKRRKWIDRLLDDPRFASHFARVFRHIITPETSTSAQAQFFQPGFEAWLQKKFRAEVPYDVMVRELLSVPIASKEAEARPVLFKPNEPNPLAFFAVKEARPENLAAAASRIFLGVQLECAQCHDHPFAAWSRTQFWSQAAFFAGIEREGGDLFAPLTEKTARRTLKTPNSDNVVEAAFLDGRPLVWRADAAPRVVLAEWLAAADNPFFAKAAVNRFWGLFFGVGIVEPVDDFNQTNLPSHPELLDDLAKSFAESGFDVKHLIRAICLSQAYQQTSARSDASQDNPRLFARMAVKALSGEQLFDSLALSTGYREPAAAGAGFGQARSAARDQFLKRFALEGSAAEPQTSIAQALMLMNGKFIADASTLASPTLIAAAKIPQLTMLERIDVLYLATLSREPTPSERQRLLLYIDEHKDQPDEQTLGDIFWMLLNCAEFRLNH